MHSHEVRSTLEVSRDSWRSIDSDLCVDSVMEADDESSKSQPGSEDSEEISENPEIRIGEGAVFFFIFLSKTLLQILGMST